MTLCKNCKYFYNKNARNVNIWDLLCMYIEYKPCIDPVTDEMEYIIYGSAEENNLFTSPNKYPPCVEINSGNCPYYESNEE